MFFIQTILPTNINQLPNQTCDCDIVFCLQTLCTNHTCPQVLGLNTNIQFLTDLAQHPEFAAGNVHTDFIPQHQAQLFPERQTGSGTVCQAAVALVLQQAKTSRQNAAQTLGEDNLCNLCLVLLAHPSTKCAIVTGLCPLCVH